MNRVIGFGTTVIACLAITQASALQAKKELGTSFKIVVDMPEQIESAMHPYRNCVTKVGYEDAAPDAFRTFDYDAGPAECGDVRAESRTDAMKILTALGEATENSEEIVRKSFLALDIAVNSGVVWTIKTRSKEHVEDQ